jgi:hypothetical protein
VKKIRLNRPLSNEDTSAIAKRTLASGGYDARRGTARAAPAGGEPPIGAIMPDGTVCAGISPDSGKPMYTTPADLPGCMTFEEADIYLDTFDAHGYRDWRLPSLAELDVLYKNRTAVGGFDESGFPPKTFHWSATPYDQWAAWGQEFRDGKTEAHVKPTLMAVRFVR